MMSLLISAQQDLKKVPEKPSGPGDLSTGDALIARHTSSSVKGLSSPLPCSLVMARERQLTVVSRCAAVPNMEEK